MGEKTATDGRGTICHPGWATPDAEGGSGIKPARRSPRPAPGRVSKPPAAGSNPGVDRSPARPSPDACQSPSRFPTLPRFFPFRHRFSRPFRQGALYHKSGSLQIGHAANLIISFLLPDHRSCPPPAPGGQSPGDLNGEALGVLRVSAVRFPFAGPPIPDPEWSRHIGRSRRPSSRWQGPRRENRFRIRFQTSCR